MPRSILSYFAGTDSAPEIKKVDSINKMPEKSSIEVFTDGSCIGNGRKTSRGGAAVVFPDYPEFDHYEALEGIKATNNRAELLAIIRAIQIVDTGIDPSRSKSIIIKTDSMLCVRTVTDWMKQWKQRGWKKADNQTPKNLDLLKQLDIMLTTRKVHLKHVAAHTGRQDHDSRFNALADRLAVKASESVRFSRG